MRSVEPYLNFAGNTREAFEFYRTVFGAELSSDYSYADFGDESNPEDRDLVAHMSFEIVPGIHLMGSDVPSKSRGEFKVGNNGYINLNPESEEEARSIYESLSAGGRIEMELAKTGWADLYASFFDKFGVAWMINYNA